MKKIINPHMGLLAVGVLQPAMPLEVRGFFAIAFREGGSIPSALEFENFLREQEASKRILRMEADGRSYYSLTLLGSLYLPPDLRKTRDKLRAYLLRDAHRARYILSRGVETELAGASPDLDTSSIVKGRAANNVGRTAFGRRFAYGQPYWPRISGQFAKRTGSTRRPRDTFPSLLSFQTREQAANACDRKFYFDYVGIGMCLGLSPQLIWNISRRQDGHYRTFEIPKKGGGVRIIQSPRVFLKVIQWFLADYVLDDLPVHECVHSFSVGKSIVTNAERHVSQRFVGAVDIDNFFGSITENMVIQLLIRSGFAAMEAVSIAKLCTNYERVPQGAPTSPVISNSILFSIDDYMWRYCNERHLQYSRYADDITVSGDSREPIAEALRKFGEELGKLGFTLNESKTRIASDAGQQRVAGVVVNTMAAPSRAYRRRARAIFHNASKQPNQHVSRISEMAGILGYLRMFPSLRNSSNLDRYEQVLSMLVLTKSAEASGQSPAQHTP
jgi:retron-type reverse transcriptase